MVIFIYIETYELLHSSFSPFLEHCTSPRVFKKKSD